MPTQTAPSLPSIAALAADGRAQLLAHVDSEIAGVRAELDKLTETRRALTGRTPTASSMPAPRPGNGDRHTTRQRRSTATQNVTEEAVMEAIRAGIGDQTAKLAAALHATPETMLRRLKALEAKGIVHREGARRDTRWVIAPSSA